MLSRGLGRRVSDLHRTLPSISVVVPTYKRPALLGRAVRSILDQSLQDFEVIVVDDASGDGTEEAVAAFSDPRIRYVRHEENRGLAAARNSGIKAARAPLVAFLDDDDDYLPSYLEAMARRLVAASDDVAFAACGVREIYERAGDEGSRDVIPPAYSYTSHHEAYRDLLRRVPFSGVHHRTEVRSRCGRGFRRIAADRTGSRSPVPDRSALLLQRIPEVLAKHHFHGDAHLNVYGPKKAEAFRTLLEKHEATLLTDRLLWSKLHYKLRWLHYRVGEPDLGREYLWDRRCSPLHMKAWWALVSYEALGARAPALHAALSRSARRAHLTRRSATEQ